MHWFARAEEAGRDFQTANWPQPQQSGQGILQSCGKCADRSFRFLHIPSAYCNHWLWKQGVEIFQILQKKDFEVCQIHSVIEGEKNQLELFLHKGRIASCSALGTFRLWSQTHTGTLSWCFTAGFGLESLQRNIWTFPLDIWIIQDYDFVYSVYAFVYFYSLSFIIRITEIRPFKGLLDVKISAKYKSRWWIYMTRNMFLSSLVEGAGRSLLEQRGWKSIRAVSAVFPLMALNSFLSSEPTPCNPEQYLQQKDLLSE